MTVRSDLLLKMRVLTAGGPADVECLTRDGTIYCEIDDVATGRKLADFIIKEDLKETIPDLLKLYLQREVR